MKGRWKAAAIFLAIGAVVVVAGCVTKQPSYTICNDVGGVSCPVNTANVVVVNQ